MRTESTHFSPEKVKICSLSKNMKKVSYIVDTVLGGKDKNLCIICLKTCSECRPIQENYEIFDEMIKLSITIEEIMTDIFAIKVQNQEMLTKVCENCLEQLLNFYTFLKRAKMNRYILESCVQELYDVIMQKDESPSVVQVAKCKEIINWKINLRTGTRISESNNTDNCIINDVKARKIKTTLPLQLNQECSMCSEDFKSNKELSEHQKLHPKGTSHICRKDGHIFKTYHALTRHKQRCHTQKEGLICPKCGKFYPNSASLSRHLPAHGNLKFDCIKCCKTFSSDISLKSHSKIHEQHIKAAVCEVCGKICKSTQLLKAHSNSHITKECPYCKKILKTHTHFNYHLKKHETGVGRATKYRTTYRCYSCEYKSHNKKTLEAHINKMHLNLRPYVCSVCGKSFYKKGNLIEHELIHTKNKSHTCVHCGEKFVNKKILSEHLRLHSGERPYPCEICGQGFITAGRRLDHKRRKHIGKTEKCQLCDKTFSLKRELTRHIDKVHNKSSLQFKDKVNVTN